VVGGGVQRRGGAPLTGVVEAVVAAGDPGVSALAAQDGDAPQEAETGAHPAGIQREPERHQMLLLVRADREPHRGDDATQSWEKKGTFIKTEVDRLQFIWPKEWRSFREFLFHVVVTKYVSFPTGSR